MLAFRILAGRLVVYVVAGGILAIAAPFIDICLLTAFQLPAVLLFIHPIRMLESYGAPGAAGALGFMPVAALCRDLGLIRRDRFALACGAAGALIGAGWVLWDSAHQPPPFPPVHLWVELFTIGLFSLCGGICGWLCGKLHPSICSFILR